MRKMVPRHTNLAGKVIAGHPGTYDRWLLFSVMALVLLGVLMVASTSMVISEQQFHQPFYYLSRQVSGLALGGILALVLLRVEIAYWQRLSPWLLFLGIGVLILVLFPGIGHRVNGSARWIMLGPINLEGSELTKLCLVIYFAGYLVRHNESIQTTWGGLLKPLVILGIVAGLLLLEPDFGAAFIIGLTVLGMIFMAGVRLSYFLILIFGVAVAAAMAAIASPYRVARLTTFLNPWLNQFDSGYQLTQSLIAFGRGGWLGLGLGQSVQKLFYLPEAHTDFLFAVLAEELGLIGTLVVIGLYSLFILRGLFIARRAQQLGQHFGAYLAYGFTFWLGLQAMVNIGVSSGLLPTKGLTLPLMSYGRSSMLISCLVVALLLRVDYETRRQLFGFENVTLK